MRRASTRSFGADRVRETLEIIGSGGIVRASSVGSHMIFPRQALLVVSTLASFSVISCKEKAKPAAAPAPMITSDNLKLIAQYPIPVKEPSGLSLSEDRKSLWTVSDQNGHVFQLDLQGNVLHDFDSGLKDLEGVTTVGHSELAMVSEREREVVITDHQGKILRRGKLDILGEANQGPESVTFNETDSIFYALKERSPGLLVTLDPSMREIARTELNFAQDYASMSFEPTRGHLWVMSEQSKAVYVLDRHFKIQTVLSIDILQPEGMTVDYEAKKMWVVCDRSSVLYVFTFSDY